MGPLSFLKEKEIKDMTYKGNYYCPADSAWVAGSNVHANGQSGTFTKNRCTRKAASSPAHTTTNIFHQVEASIIDTFNHSYGS